MSRPTGAMYVVNKIGPRTDPCGTPELTGTAVEVDLPMLTETVLPDRYESIQFSGTAVMPNSCSRRLSNVWWLTVSNAADMSRPTRATTEPESMTPRMSSTIFTSAVSVE